MGIFGKADEAAFSTGLATPHDNYSSKGKIESEKNATTILPAYDPEGDGDAASSGLRDRTHRKLKPRHIQLIGMRVLYLMGMHSILD